MALFDRFYLIAVWAPNIYFFPVSVLSERRQTSSPTGKTVMQVTIYRCSRTQLHKRDNNGARWGGSKGARGQARIGVQGHESGR